jgi:hypothetical protein
MQNYWSLFIEIMILKCINHTKVADVSGLLTSRDHSIQNLTSMARGFDSETGVHGRSWSPG